MSLSDIRDNEEFIIVRSLQASISEIITKEEEEREEDYVYDEVIKIPKCKTCGAEGLLTNKDSYYVMMCMNQNCKNITNSYIDKNDAIDAWINEYNII
jgi:hypothetical protein